VLLEDTEEDREGVGVGVFAAAVGVVVEDAVGLGEEVVAGCEKLWNATVAGLVVPLWLNSPSSKVKRKTPLLL
jgi:hypothetical protein